MELHVYAQESHHNDAYIVGDREALLALKDEIDTALDGRTGCLDVMASDGEGYTLKIIKREGNWDFVAVPYTKGWCEERSPDAIWPWEMKQDPDSQPGSGEGGKVLGKARLEALTYFMRVISLKGKSWVLISQPRTQARFDLY